MSRFSASELPSLAALDPDNSLREGRMADVLNWLGAIGADRQEIPAGSGFSALMWILADEQRRNEIRRAMPEAARAEAEQLLARASMGLG